MKKKIFLVALMAFVGFANAQMVKPTELVANYSSFNGKTISIANFAGSIRGSGSVAVSTKVENPTLTKINEPAATAPGATNTPSGSSVNIPKVQFCKILKGYKNVDFTASGAENCGCFYIPTGMVTKFQEIQKSGKMMVRVAVDSKSKVNIISGVDSL